MAEPKRSARLLGEQLGLTGPETNMLLHQQGYLDGEPGAWALTKKAQGLSNERIEGRGTGGSLRYNPSWPVTTYDASILDELDTSAEKLQEARDAASERRQQQAAPRAADLAAAVGSANESDPAENEPSGISTRALLLGVGLGVAAIVVIKAGPAMKRGWDDKVVPRLKRLRRRPAADAALAEAEPEESDPADA